MTRSTTIAGWFVAYLCNSCWLDILGCVVVVVVGMDIGCSDVGVGVGVGVVGIDGIVVVVGMGCCGAVNQIAQIVHDAWALGID